MRVSDAQCVTVESPDVMLTGIIISMHKRIIASGMRSNYTH